MGREPSKEGSPSMAGTFVFCGGVRCLFVRMRARLRGPCGAPLDVHRPWPVPS